MTEKESAIKFFRNLAAGAPIQNCLWGKSEQTVREFYCLAYRALEAAEGQKRESPPLTEALSAQLEMLAGCPLDCYTEKFFKGNSGPNLPDWYFKVCKADKFTCKRDEETVCACWVEFCKRLEGSNG